MEVKPTLKAKDVFSARVVGEAADGKEIKIKIKPRESSLTEINIQVGTLGDRQRASVIYEKIRQNLGPGK